MRVNSLLKPKPKPKLPEHFHSRFESEGVISYHPASLCEALSWQLVMRVPKTVLTERLWKMLSRDFQNFLVGWTGATASATGFKEKMARLGKVTQFARRAAAIYLSEGAA